MVSDNTRNNFLQKFGIRLEEVRKAKGLSYRKLAQLCDLDHSYISKIEKGEANVTLETILELMKGLESSPKEMFSFDIKFEDRDMK